MAIQNIALKKTATASGYIKPYEPKRAVDGVYTTPVSRWLCNGVSVNTPAKLSVDLGSLNVITSWIVRHMSVAGWVAPDYSMCDFKLQGSNDNSAWNDIDIVSNNTSSVTTRTITGLFVYRYVRLYVTKGIRTNPQLASIMELEIYGQPTPYLSGLTISSGALSPVFAPNIFAYTTGNVSNSTASINITPTAQALGATIKINGISVASGSAMPVALSVGSNTINVVVTATDGTTTQTYTITVVRAEEVVLNGISISAGTLNPTFASSTLAYTANVGYDVANITVTPSTNISGATITVNSLSVPSGTASAPINLNIGSNTITVVVANSTDAKTYTLTVTRAGNAYLTNLVVNNGMLNSTFVKNTLSYNATVGYDVLDFSITPTAEDSNATITVDGVVVTSGQSSQKFNLNVGSSVNIPVNVTSVDGKEQKAYNIVVNKPDGPYLSNIIISSMILGFAPKTFRYSKNVTNTVNSVKVTPTIADNSVNIIVNGSIVTSGQQSASIALTSGSNNIITIQIKSSVGIVLGTYIVTITKP